MGKPIGWIALLALGLILIVVGVTGRVGSLIGAVVTPAHMIDVPSH